MYDQTFFLRPTYEQSYALLVGINEYQHAPHLEYAVNDAEGLRDLLVKQYSFPEANITFLKNASATGEAIRRAYSNYSKLGLDDRLVVFFAGHGHTRTGNRGEVGFLVPVDGDPDDFSSLIRWNQLTNDAELIRAKHILFLMDACYSGLALTRYTQAGSTRFLKDMMRRISRQVLTAGKADQVVADSGGPQPNHSVFTGHLIEALQGKAASDGGIITASAVMAYVYNHVATDRNSNQTPHYGHFDGDGDFIFSAPGLDELVKSEKAELDLLITIPWPEAPRTVESTAEKVRRCKSLLSAQDGAIELHDFLLDEVRRFLAATTEDNFPASAPYTPAELLGRLEKYADSVGDLSVLLACLAHYGDAAHLRTLQKCVARSFDRLETRGSMHPWIALRWYPIILATYFAGIAAVDAQHYDSLARLFYTAVPSPTHPGKEEPFALALSDGMSDLNRSEAMKQLPGHERQFVPLSEHLHVLLQPKLDDMFFLGKNYEACFDLFEALLALVLIDANVTDGQPAWGPVGRFGWKARYQDGPLARLVEEGRRMGSSWPPIQAGLFGGDPKRFEFAATELLKRVEGLRWF